MNYLESVRAKIPAPLRDMIACAPESPESARRRLSRLLTLTTDKQDETLRAGYPEGAFRALVVAIGPDVKEVHPGDIVLLLAYKNLDDTRFDFDGEKIVYIEEKRVLGVVLT
jgi:hypothetical protein